MGLGWGRIYQAELIKAANSRGAVRCLEGACGSDRREITGRTGYFMGNSMVSKIPADHQSTGMRFLTILRAVHLYEVLGSLSTVSKKNAVRSPRIPADQ